MNELEILKAEIETAQQAIIAVYKEAAEAKVCISMPDDVRGRLEGFSHVLKMIQRLEAK